MFSCNWPCVLWSCLRFKAISFFIIGSHFCLLSGPSLTPLTVVPLIWVQMHLHSSFLPQTLSEPLTNQYSYNIYLPHARFPLPLQTNLLERYQEGHKPVLSPVFLRQVHGKHPWILFTDKLKDHNHLSLLLPIFPDTCDLSCPSFSMNICDGLFIYSSIWASLIQYLCSVILNLSIIFHAHVGSFYSVPFFP